MTQFIIQLTTEIEKAARFDSREKAERNLQGYINPPAFWNGELEHQQKQREKFKRRYRIELNC